MLNKKNTTKYENTIQHCRIFGNEITKLQCITQKAFQLNPLFMKYL